jgi:hypothetical protein
MLVRSTTIHKLNNLHFLLEQRLTPSEVLEIAASALLRGYPPAVRQLLLFPARLAGALARANIHLSFLRPLHMALARRSWIANQEKKILSSNPDVTDAYRRWALGPNAFLFRHKESEGALLIGFAPRVRRLSVSMPLFLAALEPTKADFLIIRPDPKQLSPWLDSPAFSPGFEGFVGGLRELIEKRGYREWHTMGLSFGAPLALLTGVQLGAQTVTPIGLRKNPAALAGEMPLCWRTLQDKLAVASATGSLESQIRLVYGELDEEDSTIAAEYVRLLAGAKSIAILGGGHSPLGHLFREAGLGAFLSAALKGFPAEASPRTCRVNEALS